MSLLFAVLVLAGCGVVGTWLDVRHHRQWKDVEAGMCWAVMQAAWTQGLLVCEVEPEPRMATDGHGLVVEGGAE